MVDRCRRARARLLGTTPGAQHVRSELAHASLRHPAMISRGVAQLVERQARTWYGRVLNRVSVLQAAHGDGHGPPGEDRKIGWCCRTFRRLNEHLKAVGSIPSALTMFRFPRLDWNVPVGLDECPYARRWALDFGAFSIRAHRWFASDDRRAFHDHAWWFLTIVVWGGYTDVSPAGRDRLRIGSVRFRPATHRHTVEVDEGGAVTLLITGPVVRRWGFWVDGKLHRRDRYFATAGHHPCVDGHPPVRQRPDGTRI